MILLIDNYDSFVHNLARYFQRLGQETLVVRNDAIDVAGILELRPAAIVLSPGPCTPDEAGCSLSVVREFSARIPMLGVCLGHQAIAQASGGRIVRAPEPLHGRTSPVQHHGDGLFAGIANPMIACRYHSLVVAEDALPSEFSVTARTADNVVMAIAHRALPVFGVQFHPEAILTQGGYQLLANFLTLSGIAARSAPVDELPPRPTPRFTSPHAPITF